MKNCAIRVGNLNLKLGNKLILDDLSVSFQTGQLTILLGPNGTGKSSLLKVISGELDAGGEIEYFDCPAENWKPADIARHLGVLPQSSSLTFNFTVREVVELGGLILSITQKALSKIAEDNMRKTDILHLADRLYPNLSGGERQRVHMARVLTQLEQSGTDKILLLDEPTSALDLSHQHQTLSLARTIAGKGAAVVAVIHDLNLAAQYADRVLILSQGKLVADGSAWNTLTEQKIMDVYGWPVQVIRHPQADHPVILS